MAETQTTTKWLLRRASRIAKGSLIAAGALSITSLVAIKAAMVHLNKQGSTWIPESSIRPERPMHVQARKSKASELPNNFVLVLDFDGTEVSEQPDTNLFSQVQAAHRSMAGLIW